MRNFLAAIGAVIAALLAGPALAENQWVKVDEGKTGERVGAVLVYAPDSKQMLLIGGAKDGPYVQAFDPATQKWTDFAAAGPTKDGINPYYQAAYDPGTRTVYCLSGGAVLYAFSLADKTWKAHPVAAELAGLSWHAMACDPAGKRLVVVGADKKADNVGWMRTVVYDIPTGKWARLAVADEKTEKEHRELVAAKEAVDGLVGRVRMAWFRDPKGVGTAAELKDLAERCAALDKMQGAQSGKWIPDQVAAGKTLDALKGARNLQGLSEYATEQQYPVPPSRRNSPLVFEPKSGVFVLFGGDHEDYLMNDTWVLDLKNKAQPWRRVECDVAPSPRAGHALCALPHSGRIALWEGYAQNSDPDYGVGPSMPITPLQLWLFDPKTDRWDLAGSWKTGKDGAASPAPVGQFYGYASDKFSPPELAADASDTLVLAAHASDRSKRPSQTWTLHVDVARTGFGMLQTPDTKPDQRLYRTGRFLASYCEVPDEPKDTGLDKLPDNRWVHLPAPPRNPCYGCRQRDWSTSTWDPDRDEILLWGGGHCVRSASTVVHWSPASGRMVEGFDADEPYSANGGGGFDSSILDRPWVSTHNYHHYAYDPVCRMLVSGRGYLYDPDRMDWLRQEPYALPYKFAWESTVVQSSAHGAVAWARKPAGEDFGLWLFDRAKGWTDLQPKGKLFAPYCDANGMVYDSKRDRMILSGVAGGYEKTSTGAFLTFDFKTRAVETLTPGNAELGRTHNAREIAYAEHADWIVIGEQLVMGDEKTGKHYTRVYDCAANKMFVLDAGPVPDGHETGWMYDARRRLVYVFTTKGDAWAIRLEPKTAKLLEKVEG